MCHFHELKDRHLDVLREAGNIGSAHAATALSQLIHKPVTMNIPSVRVVSLQNLNARENPVAASYIRVNGRMKGHFFMIFDVADANQLVRMLVPDHDVSDRSIGQSAYCEISNILCGSYVTALSAFLKLSFTPLPPVFAVDMEGAILAEGLVELSLDHNSVILIDAVLSDRTESRTLKGEFLFLPEPESMADIIDRIEEAFLK